MKNLTALFLMMTCSALLVLASTTTLWGQSRALLDVSPTDRWSLEFQVGLGLPLSPQPKPNSVYAFSLPSAQLGVRYMVTPEWGIRPTYGFQHFTKFNSRNSNNTNSVNDHYVTMHHAGVDLVHSLSKFFRAEKTPHRRLYNVLVHAGGYVTWAPYGTQSRIGTDMIGTVKLGGTLQRRVMDRLIVIADLSAQMNMHQDVDFQANKISDRNVGFNLIPSIGVQYYFSSPGSQGWHVDWR